jgi:hypothetical protein
MKSGKRIMAVKVLRKVRNTYRLLQAVGQDLTEWRKGVWSRLKDLPLAALRPADLGNASKNSFASHVFGKLYYTALTLLQKPLSPPPLSTGHHLAFYALSERRNGYTILQFITKP